MMSWLQLTLTVDRTQAPATELLFESLGALSVTYRDAADQPLLEPDPGEAPLWSHSRITALFDGEINAGDLQQTIRQALPVAVTDTLEQHRLEDQTWERAWMDDFHPMCFGHRLWICPAGQTPHAADAVLVDLDPGLAFGTGTHPSTALCLHWLDGTQLQGMQVLDYGCGSGILALACAKLGAKAVSAVDHDPQALAATCDNAAKNQVADRIRGFSPGQLPDGQFDILLANILADVLVDLAPQLLQRVRPGGHLILSGILQDQTERVSAAYSAHFRFDAPVREQDWIMLHGIRGDH